MQRLSEFLRNSRETKMRNLTESLLDSPNEIEFTGLSSLQS